MRAILTDRSLIGIAGPPAKPTITSVAHSLPIGINGTVIAVGRGAPHATQRQRFLAVTLSGTVYWFAAVQSVAAGGGFSDTAIGSPLPTSRSTGRIGTAYYAIVSGDMTDPAWRLGIGSAATGAAETWTSGVVRGIVYDRVLTSFEAMTVARWLATTLP